MYGYGSDVMARLGALWGKSAKRAGGTTNLLLSHLLDTAAVAEQIWDHYLAASTRRMLDEMAGGPDRGRLFFSWVCGIHDCGKATPAFQCIDETEAEATRRAGLGWDQHIVDRARWRHDRAGGTLIRRLVAGAGWSEDHIDWVWPLVAGHHGVFRSLGDIKEPRRARGQLLGKGPVWEETQEALVTVFTKELGFSDLAEVQPHHTPPRAMQLQLSGLVVMADWIASNQDHFPGISTLEKLSMSSARVRASAAWKKLRLRGGWGQLATPGFEVFRERFGQDARPSQALVLDVVRRMGGPGLVVVEAPTGEGKTKTALTAAEILAARFGADGVFVGMPTQATSDPMFTNIRGWLEEVDADLPAQVALLHGKRRFNREWQELFEAGSSEPDDCYGGVGEDIYGPDVTGFHGGASSPAREAPAEWFLGKMRGLLCPFVVGTIDQLLFAATRTKHVMLRMAGLVGKVVVLDEVHAADVYMSQFLMEGLWWLGQARVPVVLLSATLPPAQRRELVASYLAGAASTERIDVSGLPEPTGYPSVTAAWMGAEDAEFLVEGAAPWRRGLEARVEVLAEDPSSKKVDKRGDTTISPGDTAVAGLLEDRLGDGGYALVIRNTVPRAQATYQALRARFGDDVRLLHGRLHAEHRADRTEECLRLLGPPDRDGTPRSGRLIVVATQLAEQSFDADADLLVTDLAPIDLLVQRFGRVHRHDGVWRPERVRVPHLVVTGFAPSGSSGVPRIHLASEGIYGRYLLLRTAALVLAADGETWSLPGQVPHLVAQVYEEKRQVVPAEWAEAEQAAYTAWSDRQRRRVESAAPFLLTRFGEHEKPTLEGLHYGGSRASLQEGQFQALVRDGDPSVEVVLVRHDDRGFRTLKGRWLGINGEASPELLAEVLGATVRLPSKLTTDAERDLVPLDGWRDHPWLRHSRALLIDGYGCAVLGDHTIRYDEDLGLVVDGNPPPG